MASWVLRDRRNGWYFHQESMRHRGVFLEDATTARRFDSREQAMTYARALGLLLTAIEPVAIGG